jgi:hypothetical protein
MPRFIEIIGPRFINIIGFQVSRFGSRYSDHASSCCGHGDWRQDDGLGNCSNADPGVLIGSSAVSPGGICEWA